MKEILSLAAALLSLAGNLPYIYDIYRRRIEPHAYTWLVWSIVSGITFFGQIAKGAGVGAFSAGVSWGFTILIFILALKNGFKHVRAIDTYFLIAAVAGIGVWVVTQDPTISVVIAVAIDVVAFVPTIRKTMHSPHTESVLLYATNVVRHILILFSLEAYNLATMLHSVVMIVCNALMTALIFKGLRTRGDLT